jgi:cytochrome P450
MLTDVELRDVFVNFLIAGRDTTARVLTWMFYMFMIHPEILAKVHEEMAILFPDGSSDNFKYEIFAHEMPYTKAVFYETVRLYPAVPKNFKTVIADDILPCGTHVHKGDTVAFSHYCMARSADVWGPDAEVFRPERWLDTSMVDEKDALNAGSKSPFGKFKNESTFKFVNFNAGPRICLGQTFATLEALVTTVYLLQRFDFSMAPNSPVPIPKSSVTMPMRDPFMVKVSRRPSPGSSDMEDI